LYVAIRSAEDLSAVISPKFRGLSDVGDLPVGDLAELCGAVVDVDVITSLACKVSGRFADVTASLSAAARSSSRSAS
jgi:hypothetical protein